ncbi:MAG: DUF58 domain-containing protein [Phycisphaeraceae bacterium]|nr:DUF58 domain-containing protein [Phycisphaeraceae bacterium]
MSRSIERPDAAALAGSLAREVKRLEIRARRRVDSLFAGNYHSAFKGQGIEFAEVREYQPGDDVRAIDWNVTARAGRPFIKLFVEERQLTVILAVDVSGSTRVGTSATTKGRLQSEVAATIAAVAARHQDRVGLVLFAGEPEVFVPPRKGRRHLLRVYSALLGHRAKSEGTGLGTALEFVARVQRRRAIVFLISDMLAPATGAAGYESGLLRLARQHEVTVVRVGDPREDVLPRAGLLRLRDSESGRSYLVDTSSRRVRRRFEENRAERDREVRRAVARAGAEHLEVSTDRPFMPALIAHFGGRRGNQRAAAGRSA